MDIETSSQQRKSVKAAALMLDQLVPGWHRYIKPAELNMENCTLCALGQLFGDNVETSVAKVLYPELWREKWWNTGFDTALWGHNILGKYNSGMLHALCESKGLDFKQLYQGVDMGSNAFGASDELRCLWAEEAAERLASDTTDTESSCQTALQGDAHSAEENN